MLRNFFKQLIPGVNKKFILVFFSMIVIILSALFVGGAVYRDRYKEMVHPGIKLDLDNQAHDKAGGKYLVDMVADNSLEEVSLYLEEKLDPEENKVTFETDKSEFEYDLAGLGVYYKVHEGIEAVIENWSKKNIIYIIGDMLDIKPFETEFTIAHEIELEKANEKLGKINEKLEIKPREAKFEFDREKHEIDIKRSKKGKTVNKEKNIENLNRVLEDYTVFLDGDKARLTLEFEDVTPERTVQDLKEKQVEALLGSFNTEFSLDDENRSYNIKVASGYFDGILMEPGEILSFNELLAGPREDGKFKKAPVIVDGELTPGEGGGLCQVSSTLYNAGLYAGLEVIERHNHSRPIDYLPLGRDGAVAYDYLDLKLKNPFENHVLIFSYINDCEEDKDINKIYFKIFGFPGDKEKYIIESTDYEKISPSTEYKKAREKKENDFMEKKQEGRAGYKITTYRIKKDHEGDKEYKEHLYDDYYKEKPEIYIVGEEVEKSEENKGKNEE